MTPGGLPHSGIRGLTPADGYPRLIAAFHALLRLVAPRHPPCALNSSAPRNAPCRANRIELNHAHMLLLRCAAQPDQWSVGLSRLAASGRSTEGWSGESTRAREPFSRDGDPRQATKNRPAWRLDRRRAGGHEGHCPSMGSFQHVESSESWVPRLATFRRTLRLRLGQYISLAFAAATSGVDLRGCELGTSGHWGGRSWTRTRDLSLIRTAL